MTTILTNEHPAFWSFCNRLGDVLWPKGQENPRCDHSLGTTVETLNTIPGIDIPGTLEWLHSKGGHCDCEVMFNVACRYDTEAP